MVHNIIQEPHDSCPDTVTGCVVCHKVTGYTDRLQGMLTQQQLRKAALLSSFRSNNTHHTDCDDYYYATSKLL